MKNLFVVVVLCTFLLGCSESSEGRNKNVRKKIKTKKLWPPVVGEKYPSIKLYDQKGKFVSLKRRFAGKIIVIEPIGMNCPACNAFAGANESTIGIFSNIGPQKNLYSFKKVLKMYGDIDFAEADIVYVHLLLYDLNMKLPDKESAKAWTKHFKIDGPNEIVVTTTENMQNRDSYRMIPGFQLIDRNFTLISDSTGHHPKHNLYTHLVPKLKKLLQQEEDFYRIYPKNTDAPEGTHYPCAFSPLPYSLIGIPDDHRIFVTKFFAEVVKAIHIRLKVHRLLQVADLDKHLELETYKKQLDIVIHNLKQIDAPDAKLEKIIANLAVALTSQKKAYTAFVEKGVFSKKDATVGSRILHSNWREFSNYYKKIHSDVKNSIYHHLCALDIY